MNLQGWSDVSRVFLVEQHTRRAMFLKASLWGHHQIVGLCSEGNEALFRVHRVKPDIVIVGSVAGPWSGPRLLQYMSEVLPSVRRVMFTDEGVIWSRWSDGIIYHESSPADVVKVVSSLGLQ